MNLKVLSLCLSLVFISSTVQAVPFLYTFSGQIFSIESNVDGVLETGSVYNINGTNFSLGESVTYQFVADTDSAGFCSPQSPAFCNHPGGIPTDTANFDYFYSTLFSANKSVSYNWGGTTINWGLRQNSAFFSQLGGGSAITVTANAIFPTTNWDILLWDSINTPLPTIPSLLFGQDSWDETIAGIRYTGNINSSLSLLSVVALVPAPSTLLLFSIALLALLFRRKQQITLSLT